MWGRGNKGSGQRNEININKTRPDYSLLLKQNHKQKAKADYLKKKKGFTEVNTNVATTKLTSVLCE